jgi:predicted  nucleic acid-binding Zn-ribbon protein
MSDPEVQHLTQMVREMKGEMKSEMSELKASMTKLADAMVSIAKLEVTQSQHSDAFNRVFDSLRHHESTSEARLRALEEAAPVSKLIQGWVLAWIAGLVGLVGGAVAMKVLGI